MARKKVENTVIVANWDEADETLRQIGELQMLKTTRENKAQLAKNEITEQLKEDVGPINEQVKKLEAGLKLFCDSERTKRDFHNRILNFGSVFFRQRTSLKNLKGFTWKQIAEIVEKAGLKKYLKISASVKKDELRNSLLSDEKLAALGMKRHSERPFTYELDETKFEQPEPTDQPAARAEAAS